MKKIVETARKFNLYSHLGWFDRRKFRQFLRWIVDDPASLQLLREFEKNLDDQALTTKEKNKIVNHSLIWYNIEGHDPHFIEPLPENKLPEFMQIVFMFLEKTHTLDFELRNLLLEIVRASDKIKKMNKERPSVMSEQFRIETVNALCNLRNSSAYWTNASLINSNLQEEMVRILNNFEKIGMIVPDATRFIEICRDFAPILKTHLGSIILEQSGDFHEFESYLRRVNEKARSWSKSSIRMFLELKSIDELERSLNFLETFENDVRLSQYAGLFDNINFPWSEHRYWSILSTEVLKAHNRRDWEDSPKYDEIVNHICKIFEENIVSTYLEKTWDNYYGKNRNHYSKFNIRWDFDKFTDYVPFNDRLLNWTKDGAKTRRYWNEKDAERRERKRFFEEFKPRFLFLFEKISLLEIERIFHIFPQFLQTEEFVKEVRVPTGWKSGTILEEGYNKWAGFYDKEVKIARPIRFETHPFSFEIPNLEKAIYLLDNEGHLRKLILAHKKLDSPPPLHNLSHLPPYMVEDLSKITEFLREKFKSSIHYIGLYGSWQRGNPQTNSDVDIAVLLKKELPWFDAVEGTVDSGEEKAYFRKWKGISRDAKTKVSNPNIYSIAMVTQAMMDYYRSQGPIHLQNWVHAVENSFRLWERS